MVVSAQLASILIVCSIVYVSTNNERHSAEVWLRQYGYAPTLSSSSMTKSLDDSELSKALKSAQRFAGLPQSGKLDEKTIEWLRKPRCGVPDILPKQKKHRRSQHNQGKWSNGVVSYRVDEFSGQKGKISHGLMRTLMYEATKKWEQISGLKFLETGQSADIEAKFASYPTHEGCYAPFHEATLAHAFLPGSGQLAGDIHFNDKLKWSWDDQNGDNFFMVALHEIGHSIGLNHNDNRDSIMYPVLIGNHDISSFQFSSYDVYNIQDLYGPNDQPLPTETIRKITTSATTTTTPSTTIPITQPATTAISHCQDGMDAVLHYQPEYFVFKGEKFWRVADGQVSPTLLNIKEMWPSLHVDHIDAAYIRPTDRHIIFFSGRNFWEYRQDQLIGGATDISRLGLPHYIDKVDGITSLKSGETWLFAGDKIWVLNGDKVDLNPTKLRDFTWLLNSVDSAFTDSSGNLYLTEGDFIFKFDGNSLKLVDNWPQRLKHFWDICKEIGVTNGSSSAAFLHYQAFIYIVFFCLFVYFTL